MSRYELKLPDIGEGLAEAEVSRWLVKVGDRVIEDQPVLEMMTDKAAVEIPAPGPGVVVEQRVREGEVVKIGAVLYVLDSDAAIPGIPLSPAGEGRGEGPGIPLPLVGEGQAEGPGIPLPLAGEGQGEGPGIPLPLAGEGQGEGGPSAVLAPPAVRKLARDLGVDLARVRGSGPSGRISADDVQRAAAAPAPPQAAPISADGERVALRGVRRRMAETMGASAKSIAHVTGFHELDAAEFQSMFRRLRDEYTSRGRRFPFDALLVRATALAMHRHPIFNSSLDEERMELVMHAQANIGVATATPEGLIVPVVSNAGQRDLAAIAEEVDRIAAAAREGRASVADLRGGTLTISNTGAWRGGHGTSLVPPGQVALVAFGRVEERAVVRDGKVVARPMMPMSVTFDHRVIDGEQGLSFALTLRELVESPDQLL